MRLSPAATSPQATCRPAGGPQVRDVGVGGPSLLVNRSNSTGLGGHPDTAARHGGGLAPQDRTHCLGVSVSGMCWGVRGSPLLLKPHPNSPERAQRVPGHLPSLSGSQGFRGGGRGWGGARETWSWGRGRGAAWAPHCSYLLQTKRGKGKKTEDLRAEVEM